MLNYKRVFSQAIDILQPDITIPVAGGYAIRGPLAETVNWLQNRTLDHNQLIDYHMNHGAYQNTNIMPVQPGLKIDVDASNYIGTRYQPWSVEKLKDFFTKLSKEKIVSKIRANRLVPSLGRLMGIARRNMWGYQKKNNILPNYTVYFDIHDIGKMYKLSLDDEQLNEQKQDIEKKKPYLCLRLDQNTMLEWLLGCEDFNMLDSGHRISFYREPNDYVVEVYFLLSLFRV